MTIQPYNNVLNTTVNTTSQTTNNTTEKKSIENNSNVNNGVIYEKSSEADSSSKLSATKNKNNNINHSAIVAKMKEDTETRINQMKELVRKTISGQGNALSKTDDVWKFLASGNFTVDAATKAQAQADIAEDGYWGVEQTSERILDFAKALSGGDTSKADLLLDAFKKGFEKATKTWGGELPEISKKTYKAVEEKFKAWKEEKSSEET